MTFHDTQEQKDRIYSTVRSKSTSTTVNNLKPSTAYVFQIRAFTEAGYSTFGPRLEITTKEEETGSFLQNYASHVASLFNGKKNQAKNGRNEKLSLPCFLSVCLPACCICLPACLSVSLFVWLPPCLPFCQPFCLFVCLPVCPSFCLHICHGRNSLRTSSSKVWIHAQPVHLFCFCIRSSREIISFQAKQTEIALTLCWQRIMGGITKHKNKLLRINSIKSVTMLKPRPCSSDFWWWRRGSFLNFYCRI